jgi:ABC-type amino acid transport substrate-binding protein
MKRTCRPVIILFALIVSYPVFAIELVIGTTEFYPPFVMKTASHGIYGFDISLTNYMCQKLKVTCRYKSMHFKELIPAIERGEIDLAVSSLVITNERRKKVQFTIPYMLSYGGYLIRSDEKIDPNDEHFLDNKQVGILAGSVYIKYAESLHPKNMKLVISKNKVTQIDDLTRGKSDIALLDNPAAIWWARNSHGLIKHFKKPFKIGHGLGIAVSKKNVKYMADFNQAIMDWEEDGSFKKMYEVYFEMNDKMSLNTLPPIVREILRKPNQRADIEIKKSTPAQGHYSNLKR